MTGTVPPPPAHLYMCEDDGLKFSIKILQNENGVFYAQVTMIEGSADINALYFGDSVDDGSDFSLSNKLGMNGAGQYDDDGNPVDWDGAVKLSDPGLGKMGVGKDTYLTPGETMIVPLWEVDSFDDVSTIGIRATSTSTPEGSIKCVARLIDDGRDDDDTDEAADSEDEPVAPPPNTPPVETAIDSTDTSVQPAPATEGSSETASNYPSDTAGSEEPTGEDTEAANVTPTLLDDAAYFDSLTSAFAPVFDNSDLSANDETEYEDLLID